MTKFKHWNFVKSLLTWAGLTLVLVGVCFFFRDLIFSQLNSDVLYPYSFTWDLLNPEGKVWGWRMTPAPYILPELAIFPVLMAFSTNVLTVNACYIIFCIVASVYALHLFMRGLLPQRYERWGFIIGISITALLIFAHAAGWGDRHFYLMVLPGHHFGAVILGLLCLHFSWQRRSSVKTQLALIPMFYLAVFSDRIVVVQFFIPYMASLFVLAAWKQQVTWKCFWQISLILVASYFMANESRIHLNRLLIGIPPTNVSIKWDMIGLESFVNFLNASLLSVPLLRYSYLLSLLFLPVVVKFFVRERHESHAGVQLLGLFLGAQTGANLFASYLLEQNNLRHLFPLMLLPFFIICLALVILLRKQTPGRESLWFAAGSAAITVAALLLPQSATKTQARALAMDISCVTEKAQTYGIEHALSDYWPAKQIQFLSDQGIRMHQIDQKTLEIYHWINNLYWYKSFLDPPQTNYFLLTYNLDKEQLIDRFGSYDDSFHCGSYGEIWVFKDKKNPLLNDRLRDKIMEL